MTDSAPPELGFSRADKAQLERALREVRLSEERYRVVVAFAADAILVADFDTAFFVQANPAACRLFGYTEEEFRTLKGRMLHPLEQAPRIDAFSRSLIRHGRAHHPNVRMQRKDRSLFWAELRMAAFEVEGIKLYVTVIQDVTDRVERQRDLRASYWALRETQAQLVQAGKLSALGQLGAGIAHELNQPLTAIQGFAERIKSAGVAPDYVDELDIIISESRRMAGIVDNIRTFARQSSVSMEEIDPLQPLEDAIALVRQELIAHGIELVREIEPRLPRISGDRTKLQQVYLNLITNARDAIDSSPTCSGRIVVSARQVGGDVVVEMSNDGPTISDHVREQMFDPFFTTKGPDKGTGLGLSISYGIVKEHGGDIRHETPKEGGARFILRLPASES